jgi:hypothetical protein
LNSSCPWRDGRYEVNRSACSCGWVDHVQPGCYLIPAAPDKGKALNHPNPCTNDVRAASKSKRAGCWLLGLQRRWTVNTFSHNRLC